MPGPQSHTAGVIVGVIVGVIGVSGIEEVIVVMMMMMPVVVMMLIEMKVLN